MTFSPKSDLASLVDGTRCLTRRPGATLALATLGTLLSALAPILQLWTGLPEDNLVDAALTLACLTPMELYFIPRFLIAVDARAGGNPLNSAEDWRHRFEERWIRVFGAKVLLGLGFGLGLGLFLLPGLAVLAAFGWMPLRVLLRGESIGQAAKGSVRLMATAWPRVLLVVSALLSAYFVLVATVSFLISLVSPEPTAWIRLTHPALWAGNFAGSLLSLWVSTCLLALYRRVDPDFVTEPPQEA